MDEEIMVSAANENESAEEVVDTSPAEEVSKQKTEPEVSETQRVAKRIREASQKSVDDFIKAMGLTNPYDGDKPVTTRAEYDAYTAMRKLEDSGETDPVTAYRNQSLQSEVDRLRANERMRELESDPVKGETFTKLKDKVSELLDYCRSKGTPCTVDAAFNAVLCDSYFDLQTEAANTAKSETLRKITNNKNASPGALGSSGDINSDYATMTDAEFDKMYQKALRGELKTR